MSITQVSVALANEPGRLNEVCDIFEKEEINIKAIMASSVLSPVQVHMIVSDPEKAENVLQSSGYNVVKKEVIAAATPDHPGGLNAVLRALREANVNIDTLYPFIYKEGEEAIVIIDVDNIQNANEVLKKHWVKSYGTEIYNI